MKQPMTPSRSGQVTPKDQQVYEQQPFIPDPAEEMDGGLETFDSSYGKVGAMTMQQQPEFVEMNNFLDEKDNQQQNEQQKELSVSISNRSGGDLSDDAQSDQHALSKEDEQMMMGQIQ